jgi:hypothetical protein
MNAARTGNFTPDMRPCAEKRFAESVPKPHSFFKAWKKGRSSFVHLN